MDCTEEKPNFKHYCRICKKGFMCGRALGGHMRAHGIGDESGNLEDDDDQASDWEDKNGGSDRTSSKRIYQLRTNPNRLKSCRVCENCGKEFLSWKSFLEHGKCSSEDAESLVSSPGSDGEYEGGSGGGGRRSCQWSKRKRSLRTKVSSFSSAYPSSEDEDLLLAKCLVDLANARFEVEPEESCASANREEERRHMAVTFLAPVGTTHKTSGGTKGLFECKACKKVFNSHQALGGHRASHKKVKGCYAAKQDQIYNDSIADEDVITNDEFFIPSKSLQFDHGGNYSKFSGAAPVGASRRKSKIHECTICHRIFSTGQALGGHKRCHWMTSNSSVDPKNQLIHHHDRVDQVHRTLTLDDKSEELDLNLNLPAQGHDQSGNKRDPQNPWVYTDIRLQIWSNGDTEQKDEINPSHSNKSNQIKSKSDVVTNFEAQQMVEDEVDSKVKLEKLSELKGINISGSSSPWLQVGIGNSTTDVATEGP